MDSPQELNKGITACNMSDKLAYVDLKKGFSDPFSTGFNCDWNLTRATAIDFM
jgi:hypothetical protein